MYGILGINPKVKGILVMSNCQEKVSEKDKEKYPSKKLFNTEEAARYLNLKKQTLYNWRNARKGPNYTMIGRLPMYEQLWLDQFIESNRVQLNG